VEKKSLKLCEEDFERALTDASKPIDVEKIGFPFPADFGECCSLTSVDSQWFQHLLMKMQWIDWENSRLLWISVAIGHL
jgi:hypothetical protein